MITPAWVVDPTSVISRAVRPLGIVAVLIVAGSVLGPVTAAQPTPTDPAFVVDLEPDGSATVSVRFSFDLETGTERAAFDSIEADDRARVDVVSNFRARMDSVARAAGDETGRPMAITGASMELSRGDDRTGVVTLVVAWDGLAGRMGDQLVVTEPFTSGYAPDRRLLVRAPEGYAIAIAHPAPDDRGRTTASWAVGPRLDGFLVVASPDATPTPERAIPSRRTTTGGQPGFALPAAVAGLGGLVAWTLRRRRRGDRSRPGAGPPNRNR